MTCCDDAGGAGGGTGSDVVTVPVSGIVVASGVVPELGVVAETLLVAEVLLLGVSVVLEEGVGLSLLVSSAQPESASNTVPKRARTRRRVFMKRSSFSQALNEKQGELDNQLFQKWAGKGKVGCTIYKPPVQ